MSARWHTDGHLDLRIDIGARAVCLGVGATLAVATGERSSSVEALAVLGGLALVLTLFALHHDRVSRVYALALVAEGAAASVVVLLGSTTSDVFILYLTAPAFLAGVRGGLLAVAGVVSAEALTAAAVATQMAGAELGLLRLWAPWLCIAFAVGLLGTWIRELSRLRRDSRSSSYASAHRLLARLRTVTRELSDGLDIEVVSESILSQTTSVLGGTRAALLLCSEQGGLSVVVHHGDAAFTSALEADPLMRHVAATLAAQQQPAAHGAAHHRHRCCLPIAVGLRLVGLVVVDGPDPVSRGDLVRAREMLDDDALRLDSAVLFSDVRGLATVEERRRLAREIHDGVAQEIASLGYLVDDLARDQCDQRHQDGLALLRDELTRIVTELRLSIFDLRSGVSTNAGLGSVLGDYVREVGKTSGMTVHLSLEESPARLRLDVETELLRIAQEAVTNARKHSHATSLWVTCRVEPPFAEVRVEDDGRGNVTHKADHYGLHIMKERASRINAVLSFVERPGGGTAVSAVLLPPESAPIFEPGDRYALQRSAS